MSEATTADEDVGELTDRLRRAATAHAEARERVAEAGEERLKRLREHYREITGLMDRYEARTTSDGEDDVDMEAFIEYQEELAHFVEHLPEELDHRDAFEQVDEIMHQKWLKQDDFQDARDALAPVAELVDRLDERERARDTHRDAQRAVEARLRELEDSIAERERLVELGEADLDAPTERLREPIESYDEAVTEAFASFRQSASAREVLSVVAATAAFPLVEYRQPPADLREFVETDPVGEEPIPQLLEYADYSRSKLDHYVDSASELKRTVGTHQTYLQRLDAGPLTVEWPPPSAQSLRWRCKELIPVVDRFADESVLSPLRRVRSLADRDDYSRLRDSAVARAELSERERERLQSGAVADELQRLRERRERLQDALDEHSR